ncbi:aa3-type cytochrome c oxidase subunit IV [Cypionkella sp. TWP1-2-1b2]
MAEHKPGSMDTHVQEKTFDGFIRMATWGAIISVAILIFMALVNA